MWLDLRCLLAVVAGVLLSACGSSSSSSTPPTPNTTRDSATTSTTTSTQPARLRGFEGVTLEQGPELAPSGTTGTGTVDGIHCQNSEQLVYHIHAHLAVFANGAPRSVPAGIGIPGSTTVQTAEGPVASGGQCIYWLHTHTTDGVIHVESPTQRIYTLGNFFDEWHQPLSETQIGPIKGRVTAYVNGKLWSRDPTAIPLIPHAVIQLDVGSPAPPPQRMSWSGTQL